MPAKREKERIMHLYESYNAYKNQISVIEKGGRQDPEHASSPGQAHIVARIPPSVSEKTETNDCREEADAPPPEVSSHDLASLKAEKATCTRPCVCTRRISSGSTGVSY